MSHTSLIETPQLILEMTVGTSDVVRPGQLEVWINDTLRKPYIQQVQKGERKRYFVPIVDKEFFFLRFDPITAAEEPVIIHGIDVVARGKRLKHFSPVEIALWNQVGLRDTFLTPVGYHGITVTSDSHFFSNFHPLYIPQSRLTSLRWFTDEPSEAFLRPFVIGVAVVFLLGAISGTGRQHLVIVVSIGVISVSLLLLIRMMLEGWAPSPATAVGWASYNNYHKWKDMSVVPLHLALSVLLTAIFSVILPPKAGQLHFTNHSLDSFSPEPSGGLRRSSSVFFLLVLVIFYLLPDFQSKLDFIVNESTKYRPHWDADNILTWGFLIKKGLLPFRDFWYPYAGMILWELPFPIGPSIEFLHQALLWITLVIAIYLTTRRRLSHTFLIVIAILACVHSGIFTAFYRQGPILVCLLSYVAIRHDTPKLTAAHVVFWISVLLGLYVEPINLFVAAGIPLLFLTGLNLLTGTLCSAKALPLIISRLLVIPAVASSFAILFFWRHDLIPGMLSFYGSISDMASYSGYAAFIEQWVVAPTRNIPSLFLFFAGPALMSIGLFGCLRDTGHDRHYASVVLLLGMASTLVFSKYLVRPLGGENQFFFLPVTGIIFYFFWGLDWMNFFQRVSVFGICGVLAGLFWTTDTFGQIWSRVRTGPNRLIADSRVLMLDQENRSRLTEKEFQSSRFIIDEGIVSLTDAVRKLLPARCEKCLFVLSDDPTLYITTGQTPPFHINNYNSAPMSEQQRLRSWLEKHRPEVVVFNTKYRGIDGVPFVVRNSLVLETVINNYVLVKFVGHFAIFKIRDVNQGTRVEDGARVFGSTVDIGHLAQLSSFSRFKPCTIGKCSDFLVVGLTGSERERVRNLFSTKLASPGKSLLARTIAASQDYSIPVEVDGHQFSISFRIHSPHKEAVIFLDRVWFWGALKKAGYEPRLGPIPEGLQARIVKKAQRDDILY